MDSAGDDLPVALLRRLGDALGDHKENRVTEAQLAAATRHQAGSAQRMPTEFSNTVLYSPIVYLPAALSIRLGTRCSDRKPLHLLYLARIGNVIAGCALIGT